MDMSVNRNIRKPKKDSGISLASKLLILLAIVTVIIAALTVANPSLVVKRIKKNSGSPIKGPTKKTETKINKEETQPSQITIDEVKGVYIATVYNINYPSKKGLDKNTLQSELDDIITTCLEANLNTVYFQVRPSADALYKSDIFPTSEYLTGKQGAPLPDDFDPLAYLIEKAHQKGIRVHAWVNPMRITVGSPSNPKHNTNDLAEGHPVRLHPEYAVAYADGRLYFDCGIPEVRTLIADGVAEIARNYSVDGIIFDDYFYPYPVNVDGKAAIFNDEASYKKYGGDMSLADYRRESANKMIESCYKSIKAANPDCEFGVAPFGIWKNDDGKNGGSETSGLESYSAIYCDPTAWIKGGYIDYIAPQIYWRFTTKVARYDTLVRWWNKLVDGTDVKLLISHGAYNYETWENPENEIRCQVEYARSQLKYEGSILYGYAALKSNLKGLFDETKEVFSESATAAEAAADKLSISIPYNNSYIDGDGTFVLGVSDPSEPLYINGEKVSRTKSGYFSLYLPLSEEKNIFTFTHKGVKTEYVINKGVKKATAATSPPSLASNTIAAVTPSYDWWGIGTLPVTVTAPIASTVTAEIDGVKITLKPTLNYSNGTSYTKEIYSGYFTLSAPDGKIKDLGRIKFTCNHNGIISTALSANIKVMGKGTSVGIEVLYDDTELKISRDSWYYDDYTPQSAGMRDNAVLMTSGMYKLRCGGYISANRVKVVDEIIDIAEIKSASLSSDAKATYFKIKVNEKVPINCNLDKGEFCVSLYNCNTTTAPAATLGDNPLFSSVRSEKSTKVNSYKYYFKLVNIENFYGFTHYYKDGYLIFEFKNPEALPDNDKPLKDKVIVLDAGHGGKNPGALGPLGSNTGALNESDLNLLIVLAAENYLKELGAKVIQIRDKDCQIDIPVTERIQTLIEINPDLVISVHQNSMTYDTDITKIRGVVGLYWSDSGYLLTNSVGESIARALNKLDRSPTKQRLAMVRNPKFPSTLVETCFITSVEEYERMMKPDTIDKIAKAIKDGVLDFYKAQEKYIK